MVISGHTLGVCLNESPRADGTVMLESFFNTQNINDGDGWVQWLTIEWGVGADPTVPSGRVSTEPYTVLRDKTAEEDGQGFWWTQTKEFGSVSVPEPSVELSYVAGALGLLCMRSIRGHGEGC
jgi:hypothetical protein